MVVDDWMRRGLRMLVVWHIYMSRSEYLRNIYQALIYTQIYQVFRGVRAQPIQGTGATLREKWIYCLKNLCGCLFECAGSQWQNIWAGNLIWKHSVDGTQSCGGAEIARWKLIKHEEKVECGPWGKVTFRKCSGNWSPKVDREQLPEEGTLLIGHGRSLRKEKSGQRSGKSQRGHC